jgi:hypothetical protein
MMTAPGQLGGDPRDDDDDERVLASTQDEMRKRIAWLEARTEELTRSLESCRKFMLASRLLIAAGAILILAVVFGVGRPDPLALVAAIAAVLGGIVLFGSNNSTWKQQNAALRAAEAERADLIRKIDLRVVDPVEGPSHSSVH